MFEEIPGDAVRFMDRCTIAALAFIAAAVVAALLWPASSPPPARAEMPPAQRLVLSHPLGCDFTMVVTAVGRLMQRPSCYRRPVEVWL